jgi:hypothetical protein
MFTEFLKLRIAIEAIGVNYSEQTKRRVDELWKGEIIAGKEDLIFSSQGLFEILPDGSVIRVIVHAPQGPYQSRELAQADLMNDPEKGWHKYHVLWCGAVEMWRNRLRKTNRDDGKFTYPLFWRDGSEYMPGLRDGGRALLMCRICAKMLETQGVKANIHTFNVRDFLTRQRIGTSFERIGFTSDFDEIPNVYSDDWGKISRQFKEMRNWACERCFIELSAHKKYLHSHHRDHHKANNCVFNLQALCIMCHANEHPGNRELNGSPDLIEFKKVFGK